MMPMRPAARADRLVGLVPRLDGHVGDEALGLPASEVFGDDGLHLALALQVRFRGGGKPGLLAGGLDRFLLDPLDAIEPLLEDVFRARLEIVFFPAAQTIAR